MCVISDFLSDFVADSSEMIEGMWLGVTIASQREQPGGRVLVRKVIRIYPEPASCSGGTCSNLQTCGALLGRTYP